MSDAQVIEKPRKSRHRPAPPIVLRADRATFGVKDAAKAKGRPSSYTSKIADEICERIALGESLTKICDDAHLPNESTVRRWVWSDQDGFSRRYATARDAQMDVYTDRIIGIAQDRTREPNCRRVEIDAVRWLASKLAFRRYGDKLEIKGDPENPLVVLHQHVAMDKLSPVELQALEQFASARLMATDVAIQDVEDEDSDNGGNTS